MTTGNNMDNYNLSLRENLSSSLRQMSLSIISIRVYSKQCLFLSILSFYVAAYLMSFLLLSLHFLPFQFLSGTIARQLLFFCGGCLTGFLLPNSRLDKIIHRLIYIGCGILGSILMRLSLMIHG